MTKSPISWSIICDTFSLLKTIAHHPWGKITIDLGLNKSDLVLRNVRNGWGPCFPSFHETRNRLRLCQSWVPGNKIFQDQNLLKSVVVRKMAITSEGPDWTLILAPITCITQKSCSSFFSLSSCMEWKPEWPLPHEVRWTKFNNV